MRFNAWITITMKTTQVRLVREFNRVVYASFFHSRLLHIYAHSFVHVCIIYKGVWRGNRVNYVSCEMSNCSPYRKIYNYPRSLWETLCSNPHSLSSPPWLVLLHLFLSHSLYTSVLLLSSSFSFFFQPLSPSIYGQTRNAFGLTFFVTRWV